jgi:hypothetical protein
MSKKSNQEREYGFVVRLKETEKKKLESYAEKNYLSQAQVIRKLIRENL